MLQRFLSGENRENLNKQTVLGSWRDSAGRVSGAGECRGTRGISCAEVRG